MTQVSLAELQYSTLRTYHLLREMVERWSWDYTPSECAAEISERGLTFEQIEDALRAAGYRDRDIDAISDACARRD